MLPFEKNISQQLVSSSYTGKAELIATKKLKNYNAYIRSLFLKHRPPGCDEAVDFGAGFGIISDIMPNELTITCVEIDEDLVNILALRYKVVRSLAEIPDNSIKFLYSSNVLEHIENDAEALTQIFMKLAPGGVACIYVPAFEKLWTSMDTSVGHKRRYRKSSLYHKLSNAGFSILESKYVDSIGFFVTILMKLLRIAPSEVSSRSLRVYDRFIFPISLLADRISSKFLGKNVFFAVKKI